MITDSLLSVHSGIIVDLFYCAVNVYVPQNSTTVVAYSNETEVELSCEMTDFIRSDEDLRWFKDNRLILTVGSANSCRRTVTYRNATPNAAQSGGNRNVASRASVLTIANPSPSDSGPYACRVEETSVQSADIHLIVMAGRLHYPYMGCSSDFQCLDTLWPLLMQILVCVCDTHSSCIHT